MKFSPFLAISFFLTTFTLATPAAATEPGASAATPAEKSETSVDCSKETWPNFSSSCLRNSNKAVEVRLVTATRR